MTAEQIFNELYNTKKGIDFSFNMTLRAFIEWLLEQPISTYLAIIILIVFCIAVYKLAKKK